ncbi:group-specific protein [Sporosarcina highlanderae]|uniref:Group-specific protein n=1 Tax=Sporosarcina highlanderae TaxID=3035916 RepID=A0ABT8JWH9_9BACL|nr:group-specific protein [Sporosarcina highlanderae]MDN4609163.1 group-specific protein [Sporosarcina highlanderae]
MISVTIDEAKVEQMYLEAIGKKIQSVDAEKVFWDSAELKRRTCMSWNTIQDTFFHHKAFPKMKVGGKWYFPARETEEFLIKWLQRQGN